MVNLTILINSTTMSQHIVESITMGCPKQIRWFNRAVNMNFLEYWLRTPHNPGKIARQYGMEYLRHRKHILAQDLNSGESSYELLPMGFEK